MGINMFVHMYLAISQPNPVAERSKTWDCTTSHTGVAGSNAVRGTWMSVSHEFCVLSGRGLCVELIIRPEES